MIESLGNASSGKKNTPESGTIILDTNIGAALDARDAPHDIEEHDHNLIVDSESSETDDNSENDGVPTNSTDTTSTVSIEETDALIARANERWDARIEKENAPNLDLENEEESPETDTDSENDTKGQSETEPGSNDEAGVDLEKTESEPDHTEEVVAEAQRTVDRTNERMRAEANATQSTETVNETLSSELAPTVGKSEFVGTRTIEELSQSRFERVKNFFSTDNIRSMFSNLPEKGRVLVSEVLERTFDLPLNKVIAKADVAFSQMWINRHQGKIEGFQSEVEVITARIDSNAELITDLESEIEELREIKPTIAQRMERRIEKLKNKQKDLATDKSNLEVEIHGRDISIHTWETSRTLAAQMAQQRYTERLRPVEAELQQLDATKAKLESEAQQLETRLDAQREKIEEKNAKLQKYTALRSRLGRFERRDIDSLIKLVAGDIDVINNNITATESKIETARLRLDQKIQQVQQAARPYQNNSTYFDNIATRNSARIEQGNPEFEPIAETLGVKNITADAEVESGEVNSTETVLTPESIPDEPPGVAEVIDRWNVWLNQYADENEMKRYSIDTKEFLSKTRWDEDTIVEQEKLIAAFEGFIKRKHGEREGVNFVQKMQERIPEAFAPVKEAEEIFEEELPLAAAA